MIRVVIDTGVVLSAAFRNRTPEVLILFAAESKEFEWVASPAILNEYNEVLARAKFGLSEEILAEWRRTFQMFTTLVEPELKIDFARDQKDAKFLECAIASDAKYLITGDRDFEEAGGLAGATIISVSQFIKAFVEGLKVDQ